MTGEGEIPLPFSFKILVPKQLLKEQNSMNEQILHVSGQVEITLYGADGQVKDHRSVHNMVVATGREIIASLLVGDGVHTKPSKMQIGTGTRTPDLTDVALATPIANSKINLDNGFGSRTNNSVTYTATFNPGVGSGAITEAGIMNDNSTLLNRTTFAVVNKAAADTLTINWTVTIN